MQRRELPEGWDADIPSFDARREGDRDPQGLEPGPERDRRPGALVRQRLGRPHRLDLGPARLRGRRGASSRRPAAGRQLHYGIREHESAAVSNGLSLSKLRPSWSTYLVFSDYARPAIRLSALMELPVIHIFTHDSIGLGEDGPDPPAGRATRLAARDPGPERDPAVRRERGRRGVAGGDRAGPPAGRAGAHPPERPGARPLPLRRRPRACAAAATCSPIRPTATPS